MLTARVISLVTSLLVGASAIASDDIPLMNWPSPLLWQPAAVASHEPGVPDWAASGKRKALAFPAEALTFVAISPCRQYDSRSFTPLLDNTPRTVTLTGAPCYIPASAQAASVNITIFNITGAGSNGVLKVGIDSPPTTAWINFPPSETQRSNAGVVALTGAGAIVVQVNQGAGSVDFVVDVNGYYMPQAAFSHLIGLGVVGDDGSKVDGYVNHGTWTSYKGSPGYYAIKFPGLRPGCTGPIPTLQLTTVSDSGFVVETGYANYCISGDFTMHVSTRSLADVAADMAFKFSAYGPALGTSGLAPAIEGRIPSTCTFTVSTGVETCE